jgi:hypothetical protein
VTRSLSRAIRHDVDAGHFDTEVRRIDPAAVAAGRVQQRCHLDPSQQPRQLGAQRRCRLDLRTQSGRRRRAPQIRVVDALETLAQIQAGKRVPIFKEALMREHGRTVGIVGGMA